MHWSDAGAASWYDVAVAVGQIGADLGLIDTPAAVQPITTADYPTPAERRPIPFWTAPPPEPPWTSTASTGSKP